MSIDDDDRPEMITGDNGETRPVEAPMTDADRSRELYYKMNPHLRPTPTPGITEPPERDADEDAAVYGEAPEWDTPPVEQAAPPRVPAHKQDAEHAPISPPLAPPTPPEPEQVPEPLIESEQTAAPSIPKSEQVPEPLIESEQTAQAQIESVTLTVEPATQSDTPLRAPTLAEGGMP